ncbi:MAG: hypothetical protein HY905_13935 [Deltaproteobacteria bacterium]|nr:hypothetical protein [Deltaproteobacteria bacterium]
MKRTRRLRFGAGLLVLLGMLGGVATWGCEGDDGAPAVPHTLTGRSDCLSCHANPGSGAPQAPANHAGRTNDMCLGCHG